MPYALFLASCSMGSPMFLLLFLELTFPYYFSAYFCFPLLTPVIASVPPGVLWPPFYLGYSPIELWDSLSVYVPPGIA